MELLTDLDTAIYVYVLLYFLSFIVLRMNFAHFGCCYFVKY